MSTNGSRQNCRRDSFHAFLVHDAQFAGDEEIPIIATSKQLPNDVIPFSKVLCAKDFNKWVVFYENDERIEALWNNPRRYLPVLKKFRGVISPDFSLYYDMPYVMQEWNTYRGKALGHWLSKNGIEVIPNVRWGDERSLDLACLGVEKNSTIAIGTHGCIKRRVGKSIIMRGLEYVLDKLTPKTVIIYGTLPTALAEILSERSIDTIVFESQFGKTHKRGKC